jgi:signal recognition particle receptor subunit beta
VDSSDRDRLDEARQELHRIISDREMKESLLLVFANKQDIPGCMLPSSISGSRQLHNPMSWLKEVSLTISSVPISDDASRSNRKVTAGKAEG